MQRTWSLLGHPPSAISPPPFFCTLSPPPLVAPFLLQAATIFTLLPPPPPPSSLLTPSIPTLTSGHHFLTTFFPFILPLLLLPLHATASPPPPTSVSSLSPGWGVASAPAPPPEVSGPLRPYSLGLSYWLILHDAGKTLARALVIQWCPCAQGDLEKMGAQRVGEPPLLLPLSLPPSAIKLVALPKGTAINQDEPDKSWENKVSFSPGIEKIIFYAPDGSNSWAGVSKPACSYLKFSL